MNNVDFTKKKRIVVKVGSSTITHPQTGNLDYTKLERMIRQLCDLRNQGKDVILVTSGAIAVGRGTIGLKERPSNLATKQACASIGQAVLMSIYIKLFSEYNQVASQVLFTKNNMIDDEARCNAKNTFNELFNLGVIPVVNENDTISTHEIQFGDNDTLSAIVAALVGADALILLSDIDGLYTDNPRTNPDAVLVDVVDDIDKVLHMASADTGSNVGTGGMATKLKAAQIANACGADMVITNGAHIGNIHRIFENQKIGTIFLANPKGELHIIDMLEDR
ncbi:MAG: glutamate 5-kinase [Pseudobutyrivibrio sp.]|nr:glutamate 5-kinase [Pseudobutyrivibrio sp.]